MPLTLAVTLAVVMVNVCDEAPAGTVTVGGAVAALLVSVSDTTAPPLGADPLSTTLPAEVPHPPITVVGVKDNWVSAGGTTVRVFVIVTSP